jgi:DNA-binding transcriptional LysR family regulator
MRNSRFPLLSGAEADYMGARGQRGTFICDNYEVLRRMALQSEGVLLASPGLVSDDLAAGRLVTLRRLGINAPNRVPVYMVNRRGELISPAGAAIRDHVREYLDE